MKIKKFMALGLAVITAAVLGSCGKKAKKEEFARIISEMTGLNKSADEHIQNRNKLRKELDELKDSETQLIKEQLPLDNTYKNNEEKI